MNTAIVSENSACPKLCQNIIVTIYVNYNQASLVALFCKLCIYYIYKPIKHEYYLIRMHCHDGFGDCAAGAGAYKCSIVSIV